MTKWFRFLVGRDSFWKISTIFLGRIFTCFIWAWKERKKSWKFYFPKREIICIEEGRFFHESFLEPEEMVSEKKFMNKDSLIQFCWFKVITILNEIEGESLFSNLIWGQNNHLYKTVKENKFVILSYLVWR